MSIDRIDIRLATLDEQEAQIRELIAEKQGTIRSITEELAVHARQLDSLAGARQHLRELREELSGEIARLAAEQAAHREALAAQEAAFAATREQVIRSDQEARAAAEAAADELTSEIEDELQSEWDESDDQTEIVEYRIEPCG